MPTLKSRKKIMKTKYHQSAEDKLVIFFFFFFLFGFEILSLSEKIGDNKHEMSNPAFWVKWKQFAWMSTLFFFSGKIKKNNSICRLLKNLPRVLSIKMWVIDLNCFLMTSRGLSWNIWHIINEFYGLPVKDLTYKPGHSISHDTASAPRDD